MKKEQLEAIAGAITSLVAIIGIVLMERRALAVGIDGTFLMLSLALVAGLGGYNFEKIRRFLRT